MSYSVFADLSRVIYTGKRSLPSPPRPIPEAEIVKRVAHLLQSTNECANGGDPDRREKGRLDVVTDWRPHWAGERGNRDLALQFPLDFNEIRPSLPSSRFVPLWVHAYMTSAKFWDFLTPAPLVRIWD